MKNNIYVLNQRQDETFDAAGKAMRDVFSVLADKKAKIIWSVPKHCSKYLKLLDLPYLVLFLLFCVKKSDSVFYSIPENHLKIRLLKRLQLLKKYRIICFINDLNAFRYDGQNDGDPGEVRALAAADKILAPNVNTVSMLKKNGISSDMIPVGIWDYRMNETQIAKIREISHAHKKENEVKINELQAELDNEQNRAVTSDMFLSSVRKYTRARKLTPRMLNELIDKIEVYQAEKIDGKKVQRLKIHYNCIGAIEIPDLSKLPENNVSVHTRQGVNVQYAALAV